VCIYRITMQTEQITVSGMTCGGCTRKVTHALKSVSGVSDVKVSLPKGEATVEFDEKRTSSAQLKSAVQNAGYGVERTQTAQDDQGKDGCSG